MFERKLPHGLLALVVIVSLIGGFLGGAFAVNLLGLSGLVMDEGGVPVQKITEKKVYVEESSIIDAVKIVSPSVVSIMVTKDLSLYRDELNEYFLDDPLFGFPFLEPEFGRGIPWQVGGGSGFLVTKDGLVLTNRHVVEDQNAEYTVITNDGKEYSAEVVSRDPLSDIAVIRIVDGEGNGITDLPMVELGNSADLQVGQRVVAIGNALAEYQNTVTMGVISGKGRNVIAGTSENLINLLQTDAAINFGNSGGPLVNLDGEVVGINTAMADGQGIGFAIPIDDVKNIIKSVKEHGRIVRPFLGVRYMLLDEMKAKELKIDVENGALLVGNESEGEFAVIPGSPAEKAGLQIKDVILEVDGKKVTPDSPLQNVVGEKNPGDEIELKVWRSGEEITLKVTLAEAR